MKITETIIRKGVPLELKTITFNAEIKADGEKNGIGKIKGYGSVFGVIDSYNEVCDKGCFDRSLKELGMPALLLQHSPWDVGGVWVKAKEDDHGLYVEGDLNLEVQKARETYALAKQGALRGLSIGYRTREYNMDQDGVRHLTDVDLLEVSVVTFPANQAAQISAVKKNIPRTEREFENFLRMGGFSKNQSKLIVAKGFKELKDFDRDDLKSEILKEADVLRYAEIKTKLDLILTALNGS